MGDPTAHGKHYLRRHSKSFTAAGKAIHHNVI